MASDPTDLERRARRAYERGRARAALLVSSPVLAVGLGVAVLSGFGVRAFALSVLAYLVAATLWWRGGLHMRTIAPGLTAGACLLAATYLAHGFGGHACDLEECFTHCAPMGVLGGLGASAVLLTWAMRRPALRAPMWWLESAGLAAAFGSIGCSCIGFIGGLAGIGALALTATPAAMLLKRPA